MDHNLLNRLEFLNSLPKYTKDDMIKGLYSNNISSEKLTIDKIILLRTYDKYDKITKADYYVIIYFLLENIFKLKNVINQF